MIGQLGKRWNRMAQPQKRTESIRYWLSFDLGLRGNYGDLYVWLDKIGAQECGDNLATFTSKRNREQIEAELTQLVGHTGRLYIISRRPDGPVTGKFMLGRRKPAPWLGYSQTAVDVEEEEG